MTMVTEGLFSDEVFTATELNRRSGPILDRARRSPVTISRNNEQFALMRREQAAKLVGTLNRLTRALGLLSETHLAIAGDKPSEPFSWLSVYEKGDLEKLLGEVLAETRKAISGACDWDDVEALIHEWRESAAVAKSGVLDAAMFLPSAEEPLECPEEILRSVPQVDAESRCQNTIRMRQKSEL